MSQSYPTNGVAVIASASLLLILLISTASVKCFPDTTIEDLECKASTWVTNDPYGSLVRDVFNELVNNGASQPNYIYYIDYEYDYENETFSIAYGFSFCNTLLVPLDCMACLWIARDTLTRKCSFAIGAVVKMTDCMMRYDNYPFYG